jgi:hypothetical protein
MTDFQPMERFGEDVKTNDYRDSLPYIGVLFHSEWLSIQKDFTSVTEKTWSFKHFT